MPQFIDPFSGKVTLVSESMARILRARHWKETFNETSKSQSSEIGSGERQAITDGEPDSTDQPEGREVVQKRRTKKRKTAGVKQGERKVSTKKRTSRRTS